MTRRQEHFERYRAFLAENIQGGLLDVRWRKPGEGGMRCVRRRPDEGFRLLYEIPRHGYETFVGIAPRMRDSSVRSAIGNSLIVWTDCDSPAATQALWEKLPRPSLVVASGSPGRVHAYWRLTERIQPHQVEWLNKALAQAVAADEGAVTACTAILRPAGSWNWKRETPAPVEITSESREVYVPKDLARRLVELNRDHLPQVRRERVQRWLPREDSTIHQIPPTVYVPQLLRTEIVADHKVVCPFHGDTRPSLHVYDTPERGWYCFGCGRGGSIIDLAAEVWELDPKRDYREIKRRLEQEFSLQVHHPKVERSISHAHDLSI